MSNEITTTPELQATTSLPETPTAVPAVRVPETEDYETWTDDALLKHGVARFLQADRHHQRWIVLGRQTVEERLDAGHVLSIVRRRHQEDGTWCAIQDKYNLPRTTAWEVIEAYERSAEMGHSKQDVAATYETWTEVLVAYGVSKERRRKQSVPAPAQAVPVDEKEAAIGQGEDATAGSVAGQDRQQSAGPVIAEMETHDAIQTNFVRAEVHEGEVNAGAEIGDTVIEAPVQAEPATATRGTDQDGGCGAKSAAKAAKPKKADPKDQGDLSPCEIDAGNNLLKVAGSWNRAMHVLQTLKRVAGGEA